MGNYLTPSELVRGLPESQLAQLSDDTGSDTPDETLLAEVIADAEAEVDAYVGKQQRLPISEGGRRLLRNITLDLSIWRLFGRKQVEDKVVTEHHDAAVALLKRIASGDVSIGAEETAPEAASHAEFFPGPGRLFNRGVF